MALTIDELKVLIQTDEHRQLELKKTTGELKDGMHAACAFFVLQLHPCAGPRPYYYLQMPKSFC